MQYYFYTFIQLKHFLDFYILLTFLLLVSILPLLPPSHFPNASSLYFLPFLHYPLHPTSTHSSLLFLYFYPSSSFYLSSFIPSYILLPHILPSTSLPLPSHFPATSLPLIHPFPLFLFPSYFSPHSPSLSSTRSPFFSLPLN